jgi:hypothetical protein
VLKLVHGPLLAFKLPVNLAVIPLISSTVSNELCKTSKKVRYAEKSPRVFPISKNRRLIEFLVENKFEIMQHGLTHEFFKRGLRIIPEFGIENNIELHKRARLGISLLERTFGKKPKFFVPPVDTLSVAATKLLPKLYDGVLLASTSHFLRRNLHQEEHDHMLLKLAIELFSGNPLTPKLLEYVPKQISISLISITSYTRVISGKGYIWSNGFLVLAHEGLWLSQTLRREYLFEIVQRVVDEGRGVLVIALHHQEVANNTELLTTYHKLLEFLMTSERVQVSSVSDVYMELAKIR